MATIRKRKIGSKEYFYLEHTMKVGKKVEKKEQVVENPPDDWLEPKIYKGSTNF